jgi:5-methylcytosine-specific restriction endonuclease McrA
MQATSVFDDKTKQKIYAKQKGICPACKKHFKFEEMEADHILPWSGGGKTVQENCQMLCNPDNRTKSGK